jgi:hypothetical protein
MIKLGFRKKQTTYNLERKEYHSIILTPKLQRKIDIKIRIVKQVIDF